MSETLKIYFKYSLAAYFEKIRIMYNSFWGSEHGAGRPESQLERVRQDQEHCTLGGPLGPASRAAVANARLLARERDVRP